MMEKVTKIQFLKAVTLLIDRPHVVNKKIIGSHILWNGTGTNITNQQFLKQISAKLHDKKLTSNNKEKGDHIVQFLIVSGFEKLDEEFEDNIEYDPTSESKCLKVIVRNILPKIIEGNIDQILEVIILDEFHGSVHYISESLNASPKVLPELSYSLIWKDDSIKIDIWEDLPDNDVSSRWLHRNLLPCLRKWATQMKNQGTDTKTTTSLQLVNLQKYNKKYQYLKQKYTKPLMQIWTECTDPQKYIFEDLAIASYLIILWEQEREDLNLSTKQSFFDMGCGNGLLVYVLTLEGHAGIGMDLKRRKIWDQFPSQVKLIEESIEPSDKHLYPQYDWLIGNHSDELTPWIPVIAAKSGLHNRFFVIPCCAFDFSCKFQRVKSGVSQYCEYLDYVDQVGTLCGFRVRKDKLRIPSTKRICFVGQTRTYEPEQWPKIKREIDDYIHIKTSNLCKKIRLDTDNSLDSEQKLWCEHFVPRDAVQKVQNCTQINDSVKDKIIKDVTNLLLEQENFVRIRDETKAWNKGGFISMRNLVDFLKPQLKDLKKECGGLQTLLRNHRNIFCLENGTISMRIPESCDEHSVSDDKLKSKKCWFFYYHPQGCVLVDDQCTYRH